MDDVQLFQVIGKNSKQLWPESENERFMLLRYLEENLLRTAIGAMLILVVCSVCCSIRKSHRRRPERREPPSPSQIITGQPRPRPAVLGAVSKKSCAPMVPRADVQSLGSNEALAQMLEMGFTFDVSRRALEQSGWDVNRAISLLSTQR